MRRRTTAILTILLAFCLPSLLAAAPVPRQSPDFVIVEPSGKETLLSSFRGKVVVLEFLLVGCRRCVSAAQTIDKLHRELAPRGFQPIGIAIDNGISRLSVNNFVQVLQLTYPVGYTTSGKVDSYLGRAMTERFQVPQIVVIDRAGVIRAQSRPVGEANLLDESYLRTLIDGLLREGAPAGNTEKTTAAPGKAG
ncbi:MAG TPA: TlpA disulfide reductase family protein [Stellaceae bacterium]